MGASRVTHLRGLTWRDARARSTDGATFPFSVPAISALTSLEFAVPVTMLVGENGSGKSTLLEAIAIAAQLPAIGFHELSLDGSLVGQRALAAELRLSWTWRARRGFFLRAEDFFGYLTRRAIDDARLSRERLDALRGATKADDTLSTALGTDTLAADRYLAHHDTRSHGESFLDLFSERIRGRGLYLLDEPETPLSPQRQLALLGLMIDAVRDGAQFIVATHSPILLAYPGAQILSFDTVPILRVAYDDLEHVRTMRDFLNAPDQYIRHLQTGA
jgi:predicted ATPase